jgi:eukaryotic-like serine/threonine-protein kinase
MPQTLSDRNLMFGILALQMDFIGRDDLIEAMHAWLAAKEKSLGTLLVDAGKLGEEDHKLLNDLVRRHVAKHRSDVGESLAAMTPSPDVLNVLRKIGDPDVEASIAHITAEPSDTEDDGTREFVPSSESPADARFQKGQWHADGGVGRIFHACDTELHRHVAFKELKDKFAETPEHRAALVREAELTGGLEHPGVVPVYGLGVNADGTPCYAMRFLRGQTLREAIRQFHQADQAPCNPTERRLALHRLLRRFIDVCNTVAYASSRGVVHRDIKPRNIVLGNYGETVVIDWGLARTGIMPPGNTSAAAPPEGWLQPTVHTQPKGGTAGFMSPEQAAELLHSPPASGTPQTHASDVFSLGCTLYCILTGRQNPYSAEEYTTVLERTCAGEVVPVEIAKPGTPKALAAVCCKAMALRPGDRYASAMELAADVEHWLADEPVGPYRDPWSVRFARWGRRHRMKLVGCAVFLLTAVVALSLSTGLVWSEQRKTAEERRVAEANFKLAVNMGYDGLTLMEQAEATFAADPQLHAVRKKVLTHSADVFIRYLAKEPDSLERRERAAQVFRYKANVHRLEGETREAEQLYGESVRLIRELADDQPQLRDRLALTLRDQGLLLARLGRLADAEKIIAESVAISTAAQQADPQEPRHVRPLAVALLARASVEYSYGQHIQSAKTADESAAHFRKLQAAPARAKNPYDPLLLATALSMRAANERELGRFKDARAHHNEAVKLLKEMQDARPHGASPIDLQNYMASLQLQRCRTWAKIPNLHSAAETNLGAVLTVWTHLSGQFATIPEYRESLASAHLERGVLALDDLPVRAASALALMSSPLVGGAWLVARPDMRVPQMVTDVTTAHAMQKKLVEQFPQMPGYHATLCETEIAMGRLAALKLVDGAPAEWCTKAAGTLDQAQKLSPDNAKYRETRTRLEQAKRIAP